MIKNFKHKGLRIFFETGVTTGIDCRYIVRLRLILARLNVSNIVDDMRLPGLRLHKLKGSLQENYAVCVSGNWRVVFKFKNGNAIDVDYIDYH